MQALSGLPCTLLSLRRVAACVQRGGWRAGFRRLTGSPDETRVRVCTPCHCRHVCVCVCVCVCVLRYRVCLLVSAARGRANTFCLRVFSPGPARGARFLRFSRESRSLDFAAARGGGRGPLARGGRQAHVVTLLSRTIVHTSPRPLVFGPSPSDDHLPEIHTQHLQHSDSDCE